jgi:hypothetical protein
MDGISFRIYNKDTPFLPNRQHGIDQRQRPTGGAAFLYSSSLYFFAYFAVKVFSETPFSRYGQP